MNNETATKTAETETAPETSTEQPASKSAQGKPASDAVAAPETAPAGSVFRVDKNGGPLRTIKQVSAIKDILESKGDTFTKETIEKSFAKGAVVLSEFFYYSTLSAKLAKYVKELPDVAPIPQREAKQGDIVFHLTGQFFGEVIDVDGKLKVQFKEDGAKKSRIYKEDRWRFATDAEAEAFRNPETALEPTDIAPPVDTPLTKEEKKELKEREKEIETAYEQYEKAPFVMGANLREIYIKRLHRENRREDGKPMTLGEYAFVRFGIERSYAQNLMQLAGFTEVALEGFENSEALDLSVNSANQLVRGTNRLIKGLGADGIKGYAELQPIIKNTMQLLVDVAPKDAEGKPQITPRLVNSLNEKISEIVKSDTVMIDGKAMKVSEAREKGLLSTAVQAEIVEDAAEGIKRNWETIRTEAQAAYEASIQPAQPKEPAKASSYYKGEVPALAVDCTLHGEVQVASIGNGTFQTTCKCRWRIDSESGDLRCFEVRNKPVKPEVAE